MDSFSLQGIWLNFPGIRTLAHVKIAAGLYYQLLVREQAKWDKKRKKPKEPARVMRMRLLKEVERRIIERDDDDLALVLAV